MIHWFLRCAVLRLLHKHDSTNCAAFDSTGKRVVVDGLSSRNWASSHDMFTIINVFTSSSALLASTVSFELALTTRCSSGVGSAASRNQRLSLADRQERAILS